ncbi:hypothetical protein DW049_12560 [Ruminococcus sp. AF41-9]|nr:hypothetical protein DW049_12560 [Ruminococcus sp. AF41-9]
MIYPPDCSYHSNKKGIIFVFGEYYHKLSCLCKIHVAIFCIHVVYCYYLLFIQRVSRDIFMGSDEL